MEQFNEKVKAKEEDLKGWLPYAIGHFGYGLTTAIRDFKKSALTKIADAYIKEHLPNTGLTGEKVYSELEREDQDRFNVDALLKKLRRHSKKAGVTSLEHIKTMARKLIPYRYNKKHEWGPPKKPGEICQGKILKVRAYTWDSGLRQLSYHAYSAFQEIEALDKLCKVIMGRADPLTVKSAAATYLEKIRRNDGELYEVRHSINYFTVQFYKNGNAKVVFNSERAAKKIGKELVGA